MKKIFCTMIVIFMISFVFKSVLPVSANADDDQQKVIMPYQRNNIGANTRLVVYTQNSGLWGLKREPSTEKLLQVMQTQTNIAPSFVRKTDKYGIYDLGRQVSESEYESIVRSLYEEQGVTLVEPELIVESTFIPNDWNGVEQYYLNESIFYWEGYYEYGINALDAWDITKGNPDVRVAVLDSGIYEHPDLDGQWIGGYDFVSNIERAGDGDGWDDNPRDTGYLFRDPVNDDYDGTNWHGLAVSSIIGATGNNNQGMVGISWESTILPVRVMGGGGRGSSLDVVAGMRWAAGLHVEGVPDNPNPARVINLSLGSIYDTCLYYYQDAINEVTALGVTVVAGAGNNNIDVARFSPANCDNVITVAGLKTNQYLDKIDFSNYGEKIEVGAPAFGIRVTKYDSDHNVDNPIYTYGGGTSYSAPMVSAVVSLMLSVRPQLDPHMISEIIQNTASDYVEGSFCETTGDCGGGLLNAYEAVLGAINYDIPAPTPTPTPTITPTLAPTPTKTPIPTLITGHSYDGYNLEIYGQGFDTTASHTLLLNNMIIEDFYPVTDSLMTIMTTKFNVGDRVYVFRANEFSINEYIGEFVISPFTRTEYKVFIPLVIR